MNEIKYLKTPLKISVLTCKWPGVWIINFKQSLNNQRCLGEKVFLNIVSTYSGHNDFFAYEIHHKMQMQMRQFMRKKC